jgi:uncharacterized protein YgbK (DUF1537 family)
VGLANRHVVARGPQALGDRLAALRAQGVAHVVVDAVADDDLTVIAQACRDMPLITGGSAVALPLPAVWKQAGLLPPPGPADTSRREAGPAIVLSGSCSAMTNRQVAAYLGAGRPGFRLDPLGLAESGPGPAFEWLAAQAPGVAPLIYATAEPVGVRAAQEKLGAERAGALVEEVIAACALKARELGFRRFVVAGGETSGAVTKALGLTKLEVGPEIAPGVPWCFARTGGHDVAVALKSGNFGTETFFAEALEALEA